MNWIKLDIENIPTGEVLAANFQKGKHGYKQKLIGYLHKETGFSGEMVVCEDEHQILENCTHYISIHDFDIY